MYLTFLTEQEKIYFLGLAYNIAISDGEYSNEEKNIIDNYCKEMNINFTNKMIQPTDFLISKLSLTSDERTKKIILFEIIGLAMIDNHFDNEEKNIIDKMILDFKLNESLKLKYEELVNKYMCLQNEINQFVIK